MKTIKRLITFIALAISTLSITPTQAQNRDKAAPAEWHALIKGASFMDRYKAMPQGVLSNDAWGCYKVHARYIDNGIESPDISFWGSSIVKGKKGNYHMFVHGWPENSPNGHFSYVDSKLYHTVSKNIIGPYQLIDTIGPGCSIEINEMKNGGYFIYVSNNLFQKGSSENPLDKMKRHRIYPCLYVSKELSGKWKPIRFNYDLRDRRAYPNKYNWDTNLTAARREDGSFLMINRGGQAWVSKDGLRTYNLISDEIVYPAVDGHYEDPLVWKDNVQYNLIVNDWFGRVAHYMRSADGVHWIEEEGEAYVPGVSFHKDGYVEYWYKYERLHVYQDSYGRPIQANFAVIDTLKKEDFSNDNHNSKNISIPMNPGMLLTLMNQDRITRSTKEIKVRIQAEPNFNPATEIDTQTLHFGAASEVNYGRGAEVKNIAIDGKDLIVTFDAKNNCITDAIFAPKMIGKKKNGEMVFGYCRKPWMNYNTALLSARCPKAKLKGNKLTCQTVIENFGLTTSKPTTLSISVIIDHQEIEIGCNTIAPIKPYDKKTITTTTQLNLQKGNNYPAIIRILRRSGKPELLHTTLTLQ